MQNDETFTVHIQINNQRKKCFFVVVDKIKVDSMQSDKIAEYSRLVKRVSSV